MKTRAKIPMTPVTLRELREARGLLQTDLAEMVGTSAPRVSDWEKGNRVPSTKFLAPLAAALGISIEEVIRIAERDRVES